MTVALEKHPRTVVLDTDSYCRTVMVERDIRQPFGLSFVVGIVADIAFAAAVAADVA